MENKKYYYSKENDKYILNLLDNTKYEISINEEKPYSKLYMEAFSIYDATAFGADMMAIFTYNFKGADAVVTYNGHTFQEPLQLFNAEYLWNSERSAYFNIEDKPKNQTEFLKLYRSAIKSDFRPEEIYGDNGFLDVICEKIYGEKIAENMAQI